MFKLRSRLGILFLIILPIIGAIGKELSDLEALSDEQYELIQLTYLQHDNDEFKLYYQTIGDSSWIERLLELKSEEYVFLCKFKDEKLPNALDELPALAPSLSTRTLDKKALGSKIKLRKKRKEETTTYVAEPIIRDDYAFVLIRKPKSEAVYIFHRDPEEGWTRECVAWLTYVFECY